MPLGEKKILQDVWFGRDAYYDNIQATPIDSNSSIDEISAFQYPEDIRKFPNKIVKYNQYLLKTSMKVH